jgi:uncharacterized protein (DUF4415 family)
MKQSEVINTPEALPPLTGAQQASLERLAHRPEGAIRLKDEREVNGHEWEKGERGNYYRPLKRQITARVDADVLAWLKSHGKGYQTRINAILRREMLAAHSSE